MNWWCRRTAPTSRNRARTARSTTTRPRWPPRSAASWARAPRKPPRPGQRRCSSSTRPGRWPSGGAASTHARADRQRSAAEDLLQLERRRHLQLVVAAVLRRLVVAPAHEGRRVPEAVALQVVVLHLADPLRPQRLPAQVLAAAPARLGAGHAAR